MTEYPAPEILKWQELAYSLREEIDFEVEQTDKFALVYQRKAENGTGAVLTDVGIRGKRILGRDELLLVRFPIQPDIVVDHARRRPLFGSVPRRSWPAAS